jgi:DNA replication protein DnaC
VSTSSSSTPKQKSLLLVGCGGVGKSQLAMAYVFEHLDSYDAIPVASADEKKSLVDSFRRFGKALRIWHSATGGDEDLLKTLPGLRLV